MNDPSDERLGALLTATFATHESEISPGRAIRIAATTAPVRRRWAVIMAAAAAVVLVGGLVGTAVTRPGAPAPTITAGPDEPSTTYPAGVTPQPADANVAATKAEMERLLGLITMPASAVEQSSALGGFPGTIGTPPDKELAEAASAGPDYWVVPGSADAFGQWLVAHPPTGLKADERHGPNQTDGYAYLTYPLAASAAYEPGGLAVRFRPDGVNTAVEVEAFVPLRFARTGDTLVPLGAAVEITDDPYAGSYRTTPSTVPPPTTRPVLDQATLTRLVTAYDRLLGGADVPPFTCAHILVPPGVQHTYTVHFAWAGHSLSLQTPEFGACTDDTAPRLDGDDLTQTVQVPGTFADQVTAAYKAARGKPLPSGDTSVPK